MTFTKAAPGAAFVTAIRAMLLRDMGGCISPFHAFIFLQGLETLSLRVERHVENALKVVQYLNNHPQVERVHHPSVSTDPEQQELYKNISRTEAVPSSPSRSRAARRQRKSSVIIWSCSRFWQTWQM